MAGYDDLALEFTFWGDFEVRLGSISTRRSGASLLGWSVTGQSMETVRDFVASSLDAEVSEEKSVVHDDGHIQSWLEVDAPNLTFWFRDGVLYLVDWTCPWVGDTPDWSSESEA